MKKVISFSLIALGVAYAWGRKKVDKAQKIIDGLEFKISKINNIDSKNGNTIIYADLKLINNTPFEISVNAGKLLSLKKVEFYTDNGTKIAEAHKDINNIQLLSNGVTILENIEVVHDNSNLGNTLLLLLAQSPSKITAKATIEFLGKQYVV